MKFSAQKVYPERSRRGFTLIELLVVISIIAILSAVGLVSYNGIRSNALKTKRVGDLNAIKKAYETNYDPTAFGGQGGYRPISGNNFATGKIPTPDGTENTSYIVQGPYVTTANPTPTPAANFVACMSKSGTTDCSINPTATDCSCVQSDQGPKIDLAGIFVDPATINGCVLWYKADAGVSVTGSEVTGWANQCSTNNATPPAIGSRPVLVSSAINNKPAIRFDGLDDALVTGNITMPQPLTMFAVAKRSGNFATYNRLIWTSGGKGEIGFNDTVNKFYAYAGIIHRVAANDGSWYVLSSVQSGVNSSISVNGVVTTGNIGTGGISGQPIFIGGYTSDPKYTLNGYIAEIIVYNTALSGENRKRVEQYLGRKYDITVNQ